MLNINPNIFDKFQMMHICKHLFSLFSLETFLKENCYFDGGKAIKEDFQVMSALPAMDAFLRYWYNLASSLLVSLDHLLKPL